MRKANEIALDSGIYARLRTVRMSEADRHSAIDALILAEHIADAVLWVKEKIANAGQWFLKPSLRL